LLVTRGLIRVRLLGLAEIAVLIAAFRLLVAALLPGLLRVCAWRA
jgi:hypothetical protein